MEKKSLIVKIVVLVIALLGAAMMDLPGLDAG